MTDVVADTLASTIDARTAAGIADEIATLIDDGTIERGTRLPTVRDLAAAFGVSVGTIADAWSTLRGRGLVETRRRGGTHVVGDATAGAFAGWGTIDLLLTSPDTGLQPRIDGALARAVQAPAVNAWGREQIVDRLRQAVEPSWPFPAQAWMTAGGGTEGLWLATLAGVEPGRPIAVEEPAPPGYLATLDEVPVTAIGVPVDAEGPTPEGLLAALEAGASAFVHQPGGPYSTGHVLSEARAEALAAVLEPTDVVVVEDDSLGPLSTVPVRSLGPWLPDRTIRVLAFCRAYGIDLRTSVVAGGQRLVERAIRARSGGLATNSRILQHALVEMLVDREAAAVTERAKARYAARTAAAEAAFRDAGLSVRTGPASHVLWVEVANESRTALALAGRQVMVDVGAAAFVTPQPTGLLRISTAQLPEDPVLLEELADLVARAARGALRAAFG